MRTLLTTVIVGTLCHFTAGVSQAQDAGAASGEAVKTRTEAGHVKRGPREVIADKIRSAVAQKFKEAGATCDDLQVTVAVNRDSATPFQVSYRGLRNFVGSDGTAPDTNGKFIMEYIGGGEWQGKLGGKQFTVPVGIRDNIDLPFVNDPKVIGEWVSVDFVADPAHFTPDKPSWTGKLYLEGLSFQEDGKTAQPWWTWTKGVVMHHGDKTASRYEIKEINGTSYLFFEWKSGDVTISGMKPHYYVLSKKAANQ
jgi:hypothetical protein